MFVCCVCLNCARGNRAPLVDRDKDMTTEIFHESVKPCDAWGTVHPCYQCATAQHSQGAVNSVALILERAGITCHIDQTGGMTMVGVCEFVGGCFTWDSETLVFNSIPYQSEEFDYCGAVVVDMWDIRDAVIVPNGENLDGQEYETALNALTLSAYVAKCVGVIVSEILGA